MKKPLRKKSKQGRLRRKNIATINTNIVRRDDTDWIRLAHCRNQSPSVVVTMEKINETFYFIQLEELINDMSYYQLLKKTLPQS